MRPPSQLTYNDLNGKEATDVLVRWFRQLLQTQALLQPHLTLPMARISLDVSIAVDMFIGGSVPVESPPERTTIEGSCTFENQLSGESISSIDPRKVGSYQAKRSALINAAPIPGGVPPDQVREQNDLPVPRPSYGDRETGSHLFIGDRTAQTPPYRGGDPPAIVTPDADRPDLQVHQEQSGGRSGIVADGYQFSQESWDPHPRAPIERDPRGDRSDPRSDDRLHQQIDVHNGEIEIDLSGRGIQHAGMIVKDDSHRKSVKEFGDSKGERYSSVNGVYDAGPAGLMNNRGGGGLYSDGRPRISFGNNRK